MKLTYIINFIISIITYYLYNQLNKIKKTINNIDTDLNNNNKLIYELNNKLDTSVNISNKEESSYEESSDEESSDEESDDKEESSIDKNPVLNNDDQCQLQHFLNNEKKIILEFDNTNEIDYSNHIENFIKEDLSNEKSDKEELSNEELSNEELSNEELSNEELGSIKNNNNKYELSKLKLYDLQCIAKEKNINIFYLKNNKQINKTKKILIEEILS